jgi:predicted dehydrogenase
MSQTHRIGIIGLGVMGQRMLARLADSDRLEAVQVFDADAAAVQRTLAQFQGVQAATDAEQLIATPGLHSLYIATPPGPHMALANRAFDAGLAVLCEKPLTVDFDAARTTIARIDREGHRAGVNFSLASSPGLAAVQAAVQAGSGGVLGTLQSVHIELGFAVWPRAWQAAAGRWLAERAEGGFSREVLSHFIFVLQRVLGPAAVQRSVPDYPDDGVTAEVGLEAELVAAGVPVTVSARVGDERPDHNRMRWQGSDGAIELHDWFGLRQRRGDGDWTVPADAMALRGQGQGDQLMQWAALIEGRSHTLPGFAEALAVQTTIEALLAGR